MKAEILNVTPAMAADWLKSNTDNRPLRRAVVHGFKLSLQRGEYQPTHQGIAFAEDGTLLDGQHRLTAIAELREGSFPMLVTTGVSRDAFKVMDIGVKRTAADSLKEDRRLVEVARLIAIICDTKRGTVTPTMLIPILDAIQAPHEQLMAFAPRNIRTWSAAPVRLAALASAFGGVDFDYVKAVYRSLVMMDFEAMPPVARVLFRACQNGAVRAADYPDMLNRCIVVFNPKSAMLGRIQINDASKGVGLVRAQFASVTTELWSDDQEKKKAAPKSAAKSVLPSHFMRHAGMKG